jgi:Na+-transporting NADH:ubiquinone oxidoreductase subunit F
LIYVASISVFSSIIMILVLVLLFLESKLVEKNELCITVNGDPEKKVVTTGGSTLLSELADNGVLLPSACGGQGACGMCKCVVNEGGGDILPTELSHLTRKEKKSHVRLSCQLKVKSDMGIAIPEEIFGIKRYAAEVISNKNVSTFIKELVLKLDPDQTITFRSGTYIQIDIPEYEIRFDQFDIEETYRPAWEKFKYFDLKVKSEEPVFRAYSMANPPSEPNFLRFTVRIATPPPGSSDIPSGIGSSYIFSLKPGDSVTLTGPYGDFFIQDTENEICFLGGGAGMAPLRSHIFDLLGTKKTKRKLSFWYGARSKQEMFFDEEFIALKQAHENFSYHVALSDPLPEDQWTGMTGFIHQCLYDSYLSSHDDPTEIEYYLCGPPLMIDAAITMLDDLGVEPEMIHFDKF